MRAVNPRFGGEWTEEKLIYLERYLDAYTTSLKNQPFYLAYIDPFAGSGHWGRQLSQIGSPLIALEITDKPFDKLIFNDKSSEAIRRLRKLVECRHSDRDVQFNNLDANEFIQGIATKLKHPWRAVMFIDPFATSVDWQSMVAISRTETVDVLILFPRKALSRLLNRTRDASLEHRFKQCLNRFYGGGAWQQAYNPEFRRRLFEDASIEVAVQPTLGGLGIENRDDEEAIPLLYRQRLEEIFPAVSPVRIVLNANNMPYFELLFAVSNKSVGAQKLALRIFEGTTTTSL